MSIIIVRIIVIVATISKEVWRKPSFKFLILLSQFDLISFNEDNWRTTYSIITRETKDESFIINKQIQHSLMMLIVWNIEIKMKKK